MGERHTTPRTETEPTGNQQRLTVHDAARVLGISEDAVRMRVKRKTLASNKQGGRLYVYLTTDPTPDPTPDRTDALIAELQDRVRSLEDANRENRRIIAALTSRIPQLEAGQTGEDAAQDAAPVQQGHDDTPTTQQADTRPWWRRVFGG